jgi:hypothetical protein
MKEELREMRERLKSYLAKIRQWRSALTEQERTEELGQANLFHAEHFLTEGYNLLNPEGYANKEEVIHIPAGTPIRFDLDGNFLGLGEEAEK